MTTKVRYMGNAFVRGWKKGDEREVSEAEAKHFANPRAKALGFKILKQTASQKRKGVDLSSIFKETKEKETNKRSEK